MLPPDRIHGLNRTGCRSALEVSRFQVIKRHTCNNVYHCSRGDTHLADLELPSNSRDWRALIDQDTVARGEVDSTPSILIALVPGVQGPREPWVYRK